MKKRLAVVLLFLSIFATIAVAMPLVWGVPVAIGGGLALYFHTMSYLVWGAIIGIVVVVVLAIRYWGSLPGTGWIPPAWFISMTK